MVKKRELAQVKVLRLLSEYISIKRIAILLKKSPKTIYKVFSHYQKKGWINKDRSLTSIGFQKVENTIAILQKVELKSNSIRLNDLVFSVFIPKIKGWKDREKFLILKNISYKTIDLGTWKANQIVIDDVKIWLNPNKIRFYMPDSYANTSLEALSNSFENLKILIKKIEVKLNIKIIHGNTIDFKLSKQHYALVKNQFAEKYNQEKKKLFVFDAEQRLRLIVDDSLSLNELEAVDPKKAFNDSEIVQDHFLDMIEKTHYKPSDTKLYIDNIASQLKEIVSIQQKEVEKMGFYAKHIESHTNAIISLEQGIKKLNELLEKIANK